MSREKGQLGAFCTAVSGGLANGEDVARDVVRGTNPDAMSPMHVLLGVVIKRPCCGGKR